MLAKYEFDSMNYEDCGETYNQYIARGGEHPDSFAPNFIPRFKIIAECITYGRRYERWYITLLQDITDNRYYRTKYGYTVSGDNEYHGLIDSIIPIADNDANAFINWAKLDFVQNESERFCSK